MLGSVYHAIASQFASRLHPLQFRGGSSIEDRVGALERGSRSRATPQASRTAAPGPAAAPRESVRRVGEEFHASNEAARANDHAAASDLLHTFNQRMDSIQGQARPSGGAWEDFHNAFNRPSAAAPSLPTPSAPVAQPSREQRNRGGAPQHSPGGVGPGVQRGLFPPSQAGPRVKVPARPEPKEIDPRTQKGAGLFPKSAVTGTPVKNTSQFPDASAKKTSARPKVSGRELDAMVDSWTKTPARKTAAPAPKQTSPTADVKSPAQFRETQIKVHGVQRTVRTEHDGTPAELEKQHTQRVRSAIDEIHLSNRGRAIEEYRMSPAKPGEGDKEISAKTKRLQADTLATPVTSQSVQNMRKPFPKVGTSKKAAERVKDFMGDGPSDPKRSHNYGL